MRYSGRRAISRENRAIWAGSGLSIRIADRLAHVVLSVDVSKEPSVSFLQSTASKQCVRPSEICVHGDNRHTVVADI